MRCWPESSATRKGPPPPLHYHENCEHFHFFLEGEGTVKTDEGVTPISPCTLVFIPADDKHRLRATEDSTHFECQMPNLFKTTILEGTDDDL